MYPALTFRGPARAATTPLRKQRGSRRPHQLIRASRLKDQLSSRGRVLAPHTGMDRVYTHVTTEMRERLCAVLENLWKNALEERHAISARSSVPLLDRALNEKEGQREGDLAPQSAPRRPSRAPAREAEP
jgi:hypothetical protein